MNIRKLLFASVAAVAILAPRPAPAVVEVFDSVAHINWIVQLKQGLDTLTYTIQQVQLLTSLLTLENLAAEVLGEDLSGAFKGLITSAQTLHAEGTELWWSVANMQAKMEGEFAVLLPPEGGYSELSLVEMLARAKRISMLASQNNAAAVAWQATAMDRQKIALQQAQAGAAASARSRSALSAIQASNLLLSSLAAQQDQIGRTAGLLATRIEQKMSAEETHKGMVEAQWDRNQEQMKEWAAGMPSEGPITQMEQN